MRSNLTMKLKTKTSLISNWNSTKLTQFINSKTVQITFEITPLCHYDELASFSQRSAILGGGPRPAPTAQVAGRQTGRPANHFIRAQWKVYLKWWMVLSQDFIFYSIFCLSRFDLWIYFPDNFNNYNKKSSQNIWPARPVEWITY